MQYTDFDARVAELVSDGRMTEDTVAQIDMARLRERIKENGIEGNSLTKKELEAFLMPTEKAQ